MFESEDSTLHSSSSDLLFAALNESGLSVPKSDTVNHIDNMDIRVSDTTSSVQEDVKRKPNIIRLPVSLQKIAGSSSNKCLLTSSHQTSSSANTVKTSGLRNYVNNPASGQTNKSNQLSKDVKISKAVVISGVSLVQAKTTDTYARVTVGGKKILIPIIGKKKLHAPPISVTKKIGIVVPQMSATNALIKGFAVSNSNNTHTKSIITTTEKKKIIQPSFNLGSLFIETAEMEVGGFQEPTFSSNSRDYPEKIGKKNINVVNNTPITVTSQSSIYYKDYTSPSSPVKDILTSLTAVRSQTVLQQQLPARINNHGSSIATTKHIESIVAAKGNNIKSTDGLVEDEEREEEAHHTNTYAEYKPRKLTIGLPHPDRVVETSSLSSVPPPDIFYNLAIPAEVIDQGLLSSLQLETIAYACQKHTTFTPSGERAGFLIGDGAGVGKGRTIAGMIYENYLMGRKRALWFSVSNDLKYDSERDLQDIGANNIHVHMLNKFKYGKISSRDNCSVKKGVIFATYSSLIGESHFDTRYGTRLKQLLHWCGKDFDGLIVFDECHKAKNLIPSGSSKPTKTGYTVLELQNRLPKARVIYSSATGASEPRNMAYMSRLGLWGEGTPFFNFMDFIQAVERRGVGAMELVAMDLKSRGSYIARQLSFHGVSFRIKEVSLTNKFIRMYNEAVRLWVAAKEAFQVAALLIEAEHHMKKTMWGQFWAAHQRFFKYLCIAAKVDHASQLAREAVKHGKCVVIGLQSTGEARTLDLLEKFGELDDFVSTAKGVFKSLIENHFPAPNRKRVTDLFGSDFYNNDNKKSNKNDQTKAGKKRQRNTEVKSKEPISSKKLCLDSKQDLDTTSSDEAENDSDASLVYSDEDIGKIFGGGSDSEEWGGNSETKRKKKLKKSISVKENSNNDAQADVLTEDGVNHSSTVLKKESDGTNVTASISSDGDKKKTVLKSLNEPDLNPVEKAHALKEELIRKVETIDLPNNTLDELIDALGGPENVAEMTGRKGRIVATEQGNIQYESRSENDVRCNMLNLAEKQRFMDGVKNIAIISEAASSGISLQSDRRARNQRRRLHLTLELPWSADRAIQQFGRTHRSNQVNAPEYVFLISELAGEQRFASVVAKRLESLGALTHGDRRATETRDLSQYNFDNKFGRIALDSIMKSIAGLEIPRIQPPSNYPGLFFRDMRSAMVGVGLISYETSSTTPQLEKEYNNILKFMNRILGMEVLQQNAVFQFFSETLSAIVQKAKTEGQFDRGIMDVGTREDCVERIDSQYFQLNSPSPDQYNDARKAGGGYVELHNLRVERGMNWENALNIFTQICVGDDDGFYITHLKKKDKFMAVLCFEKTQKKQPKSKSDEVTDCRYFQICRPNMGKQVKLETLTALHSRYRKVELTDAKKWWEMQFNSSSDVCSHEYWQGFCHKRNLQVPCNVGKRRRTYHVLSGSVLAVWRMVEQVLSSVTPSLYKMQIVRFKTQDGGRLVGLLIPSNCVNQLTNHLRNPGNVLKMVPQTFSPFTPSEKKIPARVTYAQGFNHNELNNIITIDDDELSEEEIDENFSPDEMISSVLFSNNMTKT